MKKKKELPFSAMEAETDEGDSFAFEEEDLRTEYRPEHAYTDKETSELLREMLDALSEEQRFCMLMYYVEEHSVGEIAEVIGCSEKHGEVTPELRAKKPPCQSGGTAKEGVYALRTGCNPCFSYVLTCREDSTGSGIPCSRNRYGTGSIRCMQACTGDAVHDGK